MEGFEIITKGIINVKNESRVFSGLLRKLVYSNVALIHVASYLAEVTSKPAFI